MVSSTYIERFFWTPGIPTSNENEGTLPAFRFTESLKSEINSLTALAFSKAQKPRSASESVSSIPPEKCLVLSCPTQEGTHILDAAVRHVAEKQGADVVVLDALELAAGRLGSLGREGRVLDEMYASAASGSTESDTPPGEKDAQLENTNSPLSERFRVFIDAFLRLPISSSKNETQPLELSRRIIYFRDFQYIGDAAKPLMNHVLQSLHESRVEGSFQPITILVFGLTYENKSFEIDDTPASNQESNLFLNYLFAHTRTCLTSRYQFWRDRIPSNADWGKKVDELAAQKLSISVFAANVKTGTRDEEWQTTSYVRKIRRANQLLMRACLEKEGCLVDADWTEGTFDTVLGDQSDVLLEVEKADSIVTTAMGLLAEREASFRSSAISSPEYNPSDAPTPPPQLFDVLSEAYQILERRKKDREDWDNGIDPTETVEEGEEEEEEEDGGSDESEEETEEPPPKDTYNDVKGAAKELLGCIVDTDEISTEFSDVFVDDAIVDSLKTIVTLPLLYPQYFNTGVLAKEAIGGILLYGPPGTGKTMLCRALAKSSRAKMLHIKASDINNMWLGESEKRVTAVFELAHRIAPCIVFIDEIDSLFSSRNGCTKSWERNILTEFMQGMDGLRSAKKNRDSNIVVVGATNRPFDLDLAILRRLPRRILVDMPNLPTRKAILGSYLKDETLHDDINLDKVAAETDGFSGSDLKNLCVAAALSSVKEAIGPDWRNLGAKPDAKTSAPPPTSSSTNESSPTGEDGDTTSPEADVATEEKSEKGDDEGKEDKPTPDLPPRKITLANIAQARNEISRSTFGNKRGDELYKWHEKYSTEGSPMSEGINGASSGEGNIGGTGPMVTTAPAPELD